MATLTEFQPKTLDDAINFLHTNIIKGLKDNVDELEKYENDEDGFVGATHHFFGTNLRNSWCLWWFKNHKYETWPNKKPEIVQWFNDHEIYHADDMSGIIVTSLFRFYFNKPLELEEQIKVYHNHWLKQCGKINPMHDEKEDDED